MRVDQESPQFICEIKGNEAEDQESVFNPVYFDNKYINFTVREVKSKLVEGVGKIDFRSIYAKLKVEQLCLNSIVSQTLNVQFYKNNEQVEDSE